MTGDPLSMFPHAVDAVLDLMPTGPTWRELFEAEPGLVVARDDGWVRVLHRGIEVCRLEPCLLDPDIGTGRARFLAEGSPVEVHLTRGVSS